MFTMVGLPIIIDIHSGINADTASLYVSGNATHVTVTAADGAVGGGRTVYCTALVR